MSTFDLLTLGEQQHCLQATQDAWPDSLEREFRDVVLCLPDGDTTAQKLRVVFMASTQERIAEDMIAKRG